MKTVHRFVSLLLKFLLLMFILGLTFAYAMFQGGFVSWFLFYSFLPFAIYSTLFSFYPLTAFRVKRVLKKKRYTAGEKMPVTIELKRKVPFPLFYLLVEDILPPELQHPKNLQGKRMRYPWFKRKITIQLTVDPVVRGKHQFKAIRLKTGDMLGLIEKEVVIPMEDEIIVYPQYQEIRYRQLENKFAHGMVSSRVRLQKDASMAVGVRDYIPGDKFSWIDWKATARKNTIMTKEFEQKQSNDVMMILDRTAGGNPQMFEKSIVFANSAARAILRHDAQLGFVSSGEEETIIPFSHGVSQQEKIFYHLACVKADSRIPFADVVQNEVKKWPSGMTVMLVTHQLPLELVGALESLSYRNHAIYLFYATEKYRLTDDEEKKLNRLRVQHVIVKVLDTNNFKEAFYEVTQP